MTDPLTQAQNDPTPQPSSPPARPTPPPAADQGLGRYDANVQLILRRLADHNRTNTKPKWWWQSR